MITTTSGNILDPFSLLTINKEQLEEALDEQLEKVEDFVFNIIDLDGGYAIPTNTFVLDGSISSAEHTSLFDGGDAVGDGSTITFIEE
jgi:hypothetical protein